MSDNQNNGLWAARLAGMSIKALSTHQAARVPPLAGGCSNAAVASWLQSRDVTLASCSNHRRSVCLRSQLHGCVPSCSEGCGLQLPIPSPLAPGLMPQPQALVE